MLTTDYSIMDIYAEVVDPVPIDNDEADVNEISNGSHGHQDGEKSALDERLKKRAKRPSRYLTNKLLSGGAQLPGGQQVNGGASPIGAVNGIGSVRTVKNMRRPRNGFGRGLPKKGGAGGKGVWGLPGAELDAPEAMDEKDPNYDSDSLDNGDVTLEAIVPQLSDTEICKTMEPVILEYYGHGDTKEVIMSLEEYNFGEKRYQVAELAIELAMDHKPSNREMTSVLISDLYQRFLTERDIEKALDQLLRNLPDLVLDTPEAPTILGNFIARAVADDTDRKSVV